MAYGMIYQDCAPPAPGYDRSIYAPILRWVENAQPGDWMRISVHGPFCPYRNNLLRAFQTYMKPRGIKAMTRKRNDFLYIGRL